MPLENRSSVFDHVPRDSFPLRPALQEGWHGSFWKATGNLARSFDVKSRRVSPILAYGNLARTQQVITCLLFPCAADLWKDLRREKRLIHKAEVEAGGRSVQLWLTAIPMGLAPDEIAAPLEDALRSSVFAGALDF